MKQWYSASELAGLPGMPSTARAIQIRAKKEWQGRKRVGTKAMEYDLASLPAPTQQALITSALAQAPVTPVPASRASLSVPAAASPAELATWQRQCAEARLAFVREIQRLQVLLGKEKAVQEIVARAAQGSLPESLQGLVKVANAKAGEGRSLSRRRLFDWCSLVEKAGEQSPVALLAPKARAREIPSWAAPLLKLWGQPQKPALTDVLEDLRQQLPEGVPMPSYHQAHRFLNQRMGKVDVERGRMGPRALKTIQPFIRRDTSNLLPGDVYSADGHCFDAEVAHPFHGQPFRPEITAVIDTATRKIVGWSCDLAESRWAVLDALRCAALGHGVPALFYVDNGSGYKNDLMQAEGVGLMARLGTTMTHSRAYNSQAHGTIERSHQSLWVRAAKRLPTYIGASMDGEAKQRVHKLTRKDIAVVGRSRLLPSWAEFVAMAEAVVAEYNQRPHSALPRIADPVTLKRRHMTPDEMWAQAAADGFVAETLARHEADDLFRPYTLRTVQRAEIALFNNVYFSKALEQFHGETVQVGYDIHDASFVLVRDMEGHLIARAEWNANKRDYFPQPVVEQARQQRMEGRLKRIQKQEAEIHLERNPAAVLEHLESIPVPGLDLSRERLARSALEIEALPMAAAPTWAPAATPIPDNIIELEETNTQKYARWKALNDRVNAGSVLTEEEGNFWSLFPHSDLFQLMREQEEGELGLRQQAHV